MKPYLAISGEMKALKLPFPLTQDSENRQPDLSVYKHRIFIGMEKNLFLGSAMYPPPGLP